LRKPRLHGRTAEVIYTRDVARTAELGVVHESSPRQMIGMGMRDGPRFELFVYVSDVDATIASMQDAGVPVLRRPEDIPWGSVLLS
jgi:predicted enzyme related to lactoylglutathione lyase